MSRPRTARRSRSRARRRSRPAWRMAPELNRAAPRACRRRIESALTLLPLPISPTTPRLSPSAMSNDTPSTAVLQPLSPRNWTVRSSTESSGAAISALALQSRIEDVAQAVAEQIEAQRGQSDAETRKQHHPPGFGRVVAAFGDDGAPTRGRRRHADPEEAQRGFGENGVGEDEGHMDEQRADAVGQNGTQHDPRIAGSGDAGRLDIVELTDNERGGA